MHPLFCACNSKRVYSAAIGSEVGFMKIELRHIHKRFGPIHANNDINLTFHSGEITGILGENGAGKSTLMKILSGFQPMDSGEIWLDDRRVDYAGPQAAIAHKIGMLQQDPLDIGAFTVLENFLYGQPAGFLPGRQAGRKRLMEISQRFGFQLDPDMLVAHLTIGQRQQLEIVRLLALGVRTLILDEPTTGISAEQKAVLFKTLRELAAQEQMSILLVSHKLEDVIALCDSVAVLRAGQLVGTRAMPATTGELVSLMFGQELQPLKREIREQGAAPTVISLRDVTLRDKRLVVERLSLDLRAGEVVGLAGLDGSGQELLLRACVGLETPSSGEIILNGEVVFSAKAGNDSLLAASRGVIVKLLRSSGGAYRRFLRCGVAFGAAGRLEEGLISGLNLTEHMALVTEQGALVDWRRAREVTRANLELYDVRGQPESLVETLSGGNQQRVLMALMPEKPLLMVLENPTRGLDVDSARWIWEQLLLRRRQGTAILFSSPDLDELVSYSDRILVFYAGHVFEVADARQTTIDELGQLIGGQGIRGQ